MRLRTGQQMNCKQCSRSVYIPLNRLSTFRYCSYECYAQAKVVNKHFKCRHCGKDFIDSPSTNRKYCSKLCVNKSSKITWVATFATVRKNMKRRGLLKCCNRCGYNAFPDILGVHHKDGNRSHNMLSNLEVLCPNCHSLEHRQHLPH